MPEIPTARLSRRRRLAVAVALVGCATAPVAHVATASADSRAGDNNVQLLCSMGDAGDAEPGTIVTIPGFGDEPPLTVICGEDGHWHVVVRMVHPPSPPMPSVTIAPPTPGT